MTATERFGPTPVRGAAVLVAVAFVVLMLAARRALDVASVVAERPAATLTASALAVPDRGDGVDIGEAVALDIFSPERIAPAARYRLPGEAAPEVAGATPPSRPIVLGTAIVSNGASFATCQFESSRLLMVRVGDSVGPYLVKSIDRGRVTFQSAAGERFEILALRPGS